MNKILYTLVLLSSLLFLSCSPTSVEQEDAASTHEYLENVDIKVSLRPGNKGRFSQEVAHYVITNKGDKLTLNPGDHAIYDKGTIETKQVETKIYTSWKEGQLLIKKENIYDLAKRLERWFNIKIEIKNDKRLNSIYYTATIEFESFSEVLNLLKQTSPIDYSWSQETRTVKIFYKKSAYVNR